ncbi:tetratricopeptide repeat protein [Myxococcota bacterium]|nr:tetratricopeptide repeat protein [Myxococcota bacterium]
MKILCPQCSKSFEGEPPINCPGCGKTIFSGDLKGNFSLEGVALLYVKRDNGKEFGPFPAEKIKSLIKIGKITVNELVSQDKNKWHKLSDIPEIKAIMPDEVSDNNSDLPGLKSGSDLPGLKSGSDLPGLKSSSDLPGLKSSSDLPGLKSSSGLSLDTSDVELPAIKRAPSSDNFPGIKSSLPGVKTGSDLPGVKSNLPGAKNSGDLPGVRSDLPGVNTSLPGVRSDLPGVNTSLPGVRSDLPGVNTSLDLNSEDEKEKERFTSGFHIPTGESIQLPSQELDLIDVGQTGENNDFSLDMDENLLSDGADNILSSLEEINNAESNSTPAKSFSEQVTIPLEQEDSASPTSSYSEISSLELDTTSAPEFIKKTPLSEREEYYEEEKSSKPLLIGAGILGLLIIFFIIEWLFGFIGILGTGKKENKKPQVVQKNTVDNNKKPVRRHADKFYFEMNYKKLGNKTKTPGLQGCEAALLNLIHNHDDSGLNICAQFKNTTVEAADEQTMRVNTLKLLILSSFSGEIHKKIHTEKIKDPLKKADTIITQAISRNRKSALWNYYNALKFYMDNNYKDMRISINQARSQESGKHSALEFYAGLLGEKEGIENLSRIKGMERYAKILPSLSALIKQQIEPEFLPLIDKSKFKISEIKEIIKDDAPPALKAWEQIVAAWDQWMAGNLKRTWTHCNKALLKDKFMTLSAEICAGIWAWHGFYGDIEEKISNNPIQFNDFIKIKTWLSDGKRAAAMAVWEEYSNKKGEKSLPLRAFVKITSREHWEEKLALSFEKYESATCNYILEAALRYGNTAGEISKWIQQNIKNKSENVKLLIKLMDIISDYTFKNIDKLERISKEFKFEVKGPLIPFVAMFALSANDKRELDEKSILDSYALSYKILKLTHSGQQEQAIKIIEKNGKKIKDSVFFASAVSVWLDSQHKDRISKARFIADRAIRILPGIMDSHPVIGRLFIESGQHETGEKIFEKAANAGLLNVEDFMKWSELEIRSKRYKSALDALDRGLKKFKGNTDLLFAKATLFVDQRNPRKAVETLNEIPDNSKVAGLKYIYLGNSYLKLRQKREAEKAFSKAIKLAPDSAELHFKYAKILLADNKLSTAIKHFEKAIKIAGKENHSWLYEAHRLVGGAYKEKGNKAKAVSHIKKYGELVPDGPLKQEAVRLLQSLGVY